jgi:mannose-6-phosphate isomerase
MVHRTIGVITPASRSLNPRSFMAIERALVRAVPRPWGVVDLSPWSTATHDGAPIGEIWYERPDKRTATPLLLFKLLFTSEPLSIQVHPNDVYAHSIGLPSGKTEAWYVLSAAPEAKVAVGLDRRLTQQQLREAADDGSISDRVVWKTVFPGDAVSVPAGTIHAIGAGVVIAEIQQRSNATFRLFDYGRQRELHIERAIAAADPGPAHCRVRPNRLTDERTLLVSGPHFVLERINLPPNSHWSLEAQRETWLFVVNGGAVAGSLDIVTADVLFAQSDRVDMCAGSAGMVGLVAYTGIGPVPHLLRRRTHTGPTDTTRPQEIQVQTSRTRARAASNSNRLETTK